MNNVRVKKINKTALLFTAIVAIVLMIAAVVIGESGIFAYAANPPWLNDYEVGMSTGYNTLDTESNPDSFESSARVSIYYKVPQGVSFDEVKVRIRTKDGTAVAGEDYTAIDQVISLRRVDSYYWTEGKYDNVYIKINPNRERTIVDGNRPYFSVEIYEVLTENFTINERAKAVKISLKSLNMHQYGVTDFKNNGMVMLSGYYEKSSVSPSSLNIYSVDKAGQTLNASYTLPDEDFSKNYIKTGLATYYITPTCKLDENGVTMTSWCTLKLYDGNTSGAELYSIELRHIDEDKLEPGVSYGTMKHESESYGSGAFKHDGGYGWESGYTFPLTSGTVYETFKSGSNYWRKTYDWNIKIQVADTQAPTIKGWYIDQTSGKGGENIRLSVRFTEPVTATASDLETIKLRTKINGSGGFDGQTAVFNCVSRPTDSKKGLCTDVLAFEFDPTSIQTNGAPAVGTINGFEVVGFDNINKVHDYGRRPGTTLAYNYCKNYNTLTSLETDKVAPRQLRSSLTISFDNRSPVIEQLNEVPSEYVTQFGTSFTTSGTSKLMGTYYLWSSLPDINYLKVSDPTDSGLSGYYELKNDSFVKTTDIVVNPAKVYYVYKKIDLARTYEYEQYGSITTQDEAIKAKASEPLQYRATTPFRIDFSKSGSFETSIKGVSGTYYLYVYARTEHSETASTIRRFGPVLLDNEAPTFSNATIEGNVRDKNVSVRISDLAGVKNVVLYMAENRFNTDGAELKKFLVYGTTDDETVENPGEFGTVLNEGVLTFNISAENHLQLKDEEGKKAFGDYYVGLVATDVIGNSSSEAYYVSDKAVSFDMRNSFAPFVKIDGVIVTDETDDRNPIAGNAVFYAENAYVVDISDGPKTIVIGHPGASDSVGGYRCSSLTKMENNIRVALRPYDDGSFGRNDDEKYFENYVVADNNGTDATISLDATTTGYYEIITYATLGEDSFYSKTQRFYVTNGNGNSENYNFDKIFNVGVNLKNELFALGSSRFYSRTGTGMGSSMGAYYNDSAEPVVFSSREKAADYLTTMEYRDLYAIRITQEDIAAYNSGIITIERGLDRRPQVGEIWIRYKAATWNLSTAQRDWTYYYYGDTSKSLTINVNDLSDNLKAAIDRAVSVILQKGTALYLNSATGVSGSGALTIDPARLPKTMTVTSSIGNPSTDLVFEGIGANPLEYEFDKEVYYDKYNDKADTTLISAYKFAYLNSTKIYYAPAKFDDETNEVLLERDTYKDDFRLLTTDYLPQSVTTSGVYVIRELDEKGMRDFVVYVDKDTPSIITEYADIDEEHTMHHNVWFNETKDGVVLHTTEFTIQQIEDKAFDESLSYTDYNRGDDADTYSYVAIFNLTYGERTFEAGFSLKDLSGFNSAYELPYGIFDIEICDRAGNKFTMTVSRAKTPLATEITVTPNDNVTYIVKDRLPTEIESLYVTRPGSPSEEVDFGEEAVVFTDEEGKDQYGLVYTDAGGYNFAITDKYGYVISPGTDPDAGKSHSVADLTRVNPYENVKWLVRADDGRFVDLDASDISLFRTDNYYITSDEKLTFVLNSTSIYTYVFTGNVTYKPIERTVDDKKYVYVNVDSTERWSVKIYYTLYPDFSVTFNRIAKKAVVPAAINLRAAEKDSKGVAQADLSNRIVVYVGTQDEIIDPITVTLRTRDKSAIAELGDYDSYVGTVTLTDSEKEKMIVIQTHPSGFTTYNSTTYEYMSRIFELFIESVEGNAEKGKDTIECACPGEQELNITTKDGILVFEDYLAGAKFGLPNVAFERWYSSKETGRSQESNNEFSLSPSWMSTYINTGLANAYVALKTTLLGNDYSYSGFPDLRLTLTDVSNNSQLFRVYINKITESHDVSLGNSYQEDLKVSNESYDKKTSFALGENRGSAVAGRYFLIPDGTKGTIRFNVYETEGMYITYASAGQGGSYPVSNYIVPGRNVNDPVAYGVLVDTKAPTVKSWHIDKNTIHVGEKLRLSVRFSEPVNVTGKNPIVTANVKNSLTTIDFTYAGGAGTDTLYFEFDPSLYPGELSIEGITVSSVSHFDSICDYAYNMSKKNNYLTEAFEMPRDSEWDSSCALDTRVPSISLDGNYYMPVGPQRTASVPISISKTTKGAKMEYSWTMESDAPAMYEKSLILNATQQRVTMEASGYSGTYYLHVYMKSVYGKVATQTYGPFSFDNSVPSVTGLQVEEATKGLKERNVLFYVNDEPRGDSSSGLAQVYLYYLIKGESEPKTFLLYDVNREEDKNPIKISGNNRVSFLLTYEMLGIKKEEQKDVTLAIYAVDGLGNRPATSGYTFCPTVVNFDARSEVEVSMSCSKDEFFNADGTPVYNVLGGDPKFDFTFSRQADEYDVRELYIGGKKISEENFATYMDYSADGSGVHVTFKRGVVGIIRINFKAISGTDVNQTVQESSDVSLYLTSGANTAETANYKVTQSGTLLINKVYMLDASAFYYHNGEGVRQINYNDSTRQMAFSSRDKAVEYVKYYEMQDLGILEVRTTSIASSLNTGDGSYRKAASDASVLASVGQIWIRYKRATWDNATTPDAWVYYYYGTSSEIDPERLPASLSAAIDQVTESIVNRGGYVYLTSANDSLDKNGSPYLDKSQIVTERLTKFVTFMGNEMRSPVSFSGDPGIYDSEVTTSGGEVCSLVTTYQFEYGEFTKLFYTNQTDVNGDPIVKEYKLLPEGTVFGNMNINSGVYWMREVDEKGVRDYKVYLDKTAPTVNVVYENAKGDSVERELDSSVDGMSINGKTLKIKGFSETASEIDEMAYIAVFKKNGVLLNVYRKEDISASGVEVADGQYYLEISDRSGNVFKVNVSMNSTPMTVKTLIEQNRFLRITCNREDTEIKTFEIYLDGKLIESNYSKSVTYYQAGVYSIRIEDWFGNVYTNDCELKRELPQLNWFYLDKDSYIAYDGMQPNLKISKSGEREYRIVTNRTVMFTFDTSADYSYEFSDKSLSVSVRDFNGFTRVTVNDPVDWTVTVRYAKYPDIYVVYNCLVDQTAPIINVTARQDIVQYFDAKELEDANTYKLDASSPEYFVPDTVYFAVSKTVSKAVRNNSTVYSPLLTLQFTDKSICSEVEIYLDGVMIREFSESEGVNNVTVSRFGEYRVVARDTLGNQSEFNFINKVSDDARFYADGKEIDLKLSPAEAIVLGDDETYHYEPDVYAYSNLEMKYDGSATMAILIEKDGEKHYLRFESVNGALYQVAYRLLRVTDEEGNPLYDDNDEEIYLYQQIYSSTVISDLNTAEKDKMYVLAEEEEVGADIYVHFDAEGHVYYRIDAPKNGEAAIEFRVMYNEEYQPYFVKAIMCGELPEITLKRTDEEGKEVVPSSTEEVVYLNGGFFIKETSFKNITEIKIAYSETTEFGEYETVYTQNEGYTELVFEEEGIYSVVVKNIYGREAKFIVIMATELRVVVTTAYKDDASNQYNAKSGQSFKSNESVTVDVYFEHITYVLTHNGVQQQEKELRDRSGACSVTCKEEGTYELKIKDDFGNIVELFFEIKDTPFGFKKEYLTGYNEKALRVDEGYTNKKLSVEGEKMVADGILQAIVVVKDEEFVVFDVLRANAVPLSEDRLADAIGRSGDGVYTLRMRNAYGNVSTTVLHYMGTDTVSVSRLIRTSRDPEPLTIMQGELNKLYSNYSVTFETVAGRYEIRIDGSKADMPLVVTYPSDGEEAGEYVKNVTYIDEYGFEYEFEVNLIRKTLEIDLTNFMKIVTIKDVVMTQENVSIEFDKSVSCEVSLNGGERTPYKSGEVLTADGTYRFYITDIAGNIFSTMVRKDTLVEYTFLVGTTDRVVDNGSVVTDGGARFMPVNKDSAQIQLVVLNGEAYDMSKSTTFSETGKWEFIVGDDIGNKSYYYFYVVTHSLARFEYDSPYGYKITNVQYDGGDGVLVSYNNSVIQNENNSKMSFTDMGAYIVNVSSMASSAQFSFEIVIDKTPPAAKLVGAEDGQPTIENVTLEECVVGDVIRVYKDGKLTQTVTVTSNTMKMPEITEQGEYKIVVTNAAGNEKTFEFTRKYTANIATTIAIFAICIIFAVGIMIVLFVRKRKKV